MKTIKFIAVAVMCLLSLTTNAQSIMRIELTGGKQVDYPVSSVANIKWFTSTPDTSPSGAEAVDLGLSVKWANMNIGATKTDEYGDYFAWGETSPQTNNRYYLDSYNWCNGSSKTMTKYCTNFSYGKVDNNTTLEPSDDAAHVNWGGSWRMPTESEIKELVEKCTWSWISFKNKNGYMVTGPNGNSILLLAAGTRDKDSRKGLGEKGYYWSSSLDTEYQNLASFLNFYSGAEEWGGHGSYARYCGASVRAVCP